MQEKIGLLTKIKLTKSNCLIMVLMGILLIIIAWPTEKQKKSNLQAQDQKQASKTTTELPNILGSTTNSETREEALIKSADNFQDLLSYTSYLEKSLEGFLRTIDGAGQVKVMVMLESSSEAVVEKDVITSHAGTTEVDAAGGSRNTSDLKKEEKTLYLGEKTETNQPYVKKVLTPKISGVIVSAQGAGNNLVADNISEAIQVLFDIDVHKIKIVKMIS